MIRVLSLQEEEVLALIVENDGLPPVDSVGIYHDIAGLRLAKDPIQPHGRKSPRINQIPQNVSRTNAGQLIDIADQNQAGLISDRLEQSVHEGNIHHGHLIDNDDLCLQGVELVALKSPQRLSLLSRAAADLQETVDGFRLTSSRLRHALGRPTGRGGKLYIETLVQKIVEHGSNGCGFPGPRPAGHQADPMANGCGDRLLLLGIQFHPLALLQSGNCRFNLVILHMIVVI